MAINVSNHLNFRGDARAALEFYQSVFGGELVIVTNTDMQSVEDPSEADQVKWGQVSAENGFRIMAYDVPASLPYDQGVNSAFVSVRGDSADEIALLWAKLVVGSTIVHDIAPSAFSPLFGMLKDPFGVVWVLDVAVEYP